MQVKNNPPTRGESTVGGIIIFLIAGAFMVYWLLPNTGVLFDRNVAKGTIEGTGKNHITVSYVNAYDHRTYYVGRKVDLRLERHLKSNPVTIEVAYSRFFPENATLPEVENDHSVFSLLSLLVIAVTAFSVIKNDLVKHFK
jgi:hypothetical protein